MKQRFVVVDIETTGNSPKKGDKIIQFAAVVIEDGEICERFASFINPGRDIPPFIEQFTGITSEVVYNAPSFDLIAPEINLLLEGAYFVAHNVPFDLTFLQEELTNCGYDHFKGPTLDTVELARIMIPSTESYKLGQLAENFSLSHDNPHQADSDAEVTAEILLKILTKVKSLPLDTCARLLQYAPYLKSDIHTILSSIIEEKERNVTSEGKLFDIYRGIALKAKSKDQMKDDTKPYIYDTFKKQLFGENGLLSTSMDRYEEREGQIEMMDIVNAALDAHQHTLIEAGTGIGKTLAYLIPSIIYAKNHGRPIVISTNTIQLQQQLLEHDVPILKKVIPFSFDVSLLKGRSHYLCLRKFEQVLYEQETNYDSILAKAQILVWLTETDTGDVDELNLPSGGRLLWNRVKSDRNTSLGKECPWRSRCFYRNAKRKAQISDLIITNHALLFSDLTSESDILPTYKEVIIDEAHHIENIASEHLGYKLDYLELHNLFIRIGTIDSKDLFAKVVKIFKGIGLGGEKSIDLIDLVVKEIRIQLDDLFTLIRSFVLQHTKQIDSSNNRVYFRLDSSVEDHNSWWGISEGSTKLISKLKTFHALIVEQRNLFKPLQKLVTPLQKGIIYDFFSISNSTSTAIDKITTLIQRTNSKGVTWFEADTKGAKNSVFLYNQPTDVSEKLADLFYSNKKCVIMTSATLSIKGSFSYTVNRLGLEDFQPQTYSIPSPFDYKKQAAIMIPTDLPDIKVVSLDEYVHSIAIHIAEIANKTNGRMLVLFTSYEMLKLTYSTLKEIPFLTEFIIIAQGVSGGSRTKLTKNFQAFAKSILLGTSSFWEGVDIPGEDLTTLVIVRLPFSPPDDPVYAARAEQIKKIGRNPFKELALPQAIIRFKQGFGRLVRTKDDKGVVFVFDRRITTTTYGNQFLLALPEISVQEEPLHTLLDKLDKLI